MSISILSFTFKRLSSLAYTFVSNSNGVVSWVLSIVIQFPISSLTFHESFRLRNWNVHMNVKHFDAKARATATTVSRLYSTRIPVRRWFDKEIKTHWENIQFKWIQRWTFHRHIILWRVWHSHDVCEIFFSDVNSTHSRDSCKRKIHFVLHQCLEYTLHVCFTPYWTIVHVFVYVGMYQREFYCEKLIYECSHFDNTHTHTLTFFAISYFGISETR